LESAIHLKAEEELFPIKKEKISHFYISQDLSSQHFTTCHLVKAEEKKELALQLLLGFEGFFL